MITEDATATERSRKFSGIILPDELRLLSLNVISSLQYLPL